MLYIMKDICLSGMLYLLESWQWSISYRQEKNSVKHKTVDCTYNLDATIDVLSIVGKVERIGTCVGVVTIFEGWVLSAVGVVEPARFGEVAVFGQPLKRVASVAQTVGHKWLLRLGEQIAGMCGSWQGWLEQSKAGGPVEERQHLYTI